MDEDNSSLSGEPSEGKACDDSCEDMSLEILNQRKRAADDNARAQETVSSKRGSPWRNVYTYAAEDPNTEMVSLRTLQLPSTSEGVIYTREDFSSHIMEIGDSDKSPLHESEVQSNVELHSEQLTSKEPTIVDVPEVTNQHTSADSGNMPATPGSAQNIINVTNSQNVNVIESIEGNSIYIGDTPLQRLHEKTQMLLRQYTKGMIKTSACDEIKSKIEQGVQWISVIGDPGEGKTTAAYLVLDHYYAAGKRVYKIDLPEQYSIARQGNQDKDVILMLNDIFGDFDFDPLCIGTWKNVLEDLLQLMRMSDRTVTVLNVQRTGIFKVALKQMGKYKRMLNQKDNVVNVSELNNPLNEKYNMWKHYGKKFQINRNTVEFALQNTIPHGFPSCCHIFATKYNQSPNINQEFQTFFLMPLLFINEDIGRLIECEHTASFFKAMLKEGDSITTGQNEDERNCYTFKDVVNKLTGTYLEEKNGTVSFKHDAFYHSVAACLVQKDPCFIIRNCLTTVLSRIQFKSIGLKEYDFDDFIVDDSCLPHFLERCTSEIMKGNILPVLSHQAWVNQKCAHDLMMSLTNKSEETLENVIRKKDKNGNSFLFLSTASAPPHVFQYICSNHSLLPEDKREAVFGICKHDAVEALDHFLIAYQDFDFSIKNGEGHTPEMAAAAAGSKKCLKLLSQKGNRKVSVALEDRSGKTILHHICITGGEKKTVRELIIAGAEVNRFCSSSMSPLYYAAENGHDEIVMELIEWGADVNIHSQAVSTPLHAAVRAGQNKTINILLDNGSQAEPYTDLVKRAIWDRHTHTVELLCQRRKSSIDDLNEWLNIACAAGNVEMVSILANCGANINESFYWHIHTPEKLYIQPTSMTEKTRQTTTPLRFPRLCSSWRGNRTTHIRTVTTRQMTPPIFTAYLHGHHEVVRRLIQLGADVNKKASDGCAVFSNALEPQEKTMLSLLEVPIDLNLTGRCGNTLLHEACENRFKTVILKLCEIGANVNKTNCAKEISLHVVCRSFYGTVLSDTISEAEHVLKDIVIMLVKRGADVNKKDINGYTPFHVACKFKRSRIARYLMEKGADLNRETNKSETPLYLLCDDFSKVKDIMLLAEEMIEKGSDPRDLRGWYKGHYYQKQALLRYEATKVR